MLAPYYPGIDWQTAEAKTLVKTMKRQSRESLLITKKLNPFGRMDDDHKLVVLTSANAEV